MLPISSTGQPLIPCPNHRAGEDSHFTEPTGRLLYRGVICRDLLVKPAIIAEESCRRCNLRFLHSNRGVIAKLPLEHQNLLDISVDANLGDPSLVVSESIVNVIRTDFRQRQGSANFEAKANEACGDESARLAGGYLGTGRAFHEELISKVDDKIWSDMSLSKKRVYVDDRAELLALERDGLLLQRWPLNPHIAISSPPVPRFGT